MQEVKRCRLKQAAVPQGWKKFSEIRKLSKNTSSKTISFDVVTVGGRLIYNNASYFRR